LKLVLSSLPRLLTKDDSAGRDGAPGRKDANPRDRASGTLNGSHFAMINFTEQQAGGLALDQNGGYSAAF
jgi:hypothetical protein